MKNLFTKVVKTEKAKPALVVLCCKGIRCCKG